MLENVVIPPQSISPPAPIPLFYSEIQNIISRLKEWIEWAPTSVCGCFERGLRHSTDHAFSLKPFRRRPLIEEARTKKKIKALKAKQIEG